MKMFKSLLVILSLTLAATTARSQSTNIVGLYVSGTNSIIGNSTSENNLLSYAQGNGFNYLAFYSLQGLDWTNSTVKTNVANFIRKAKTQYGILQVGATTETYTFVTNNILPYNAGRTDANEKFDVINFEFEFWVSTSVANSYCSQYLTPNGYSCDSAGAFAYAWSLFQQIDAATAANGLISEVYFGWPNLGQMQKFASRADRILLHAYRVSDSDVYAYSKTRLSYIASLNTPVTVLPIFSSESSFMGPWLASHPITQPYTTYSAGYQAETATWKPYINLQGYQWFKSTTMPQTTSLFAAITSSGSTSLCTGGSVTLTANSGSGYTYQWMNNGTNISGATAISYTASAAGSYTVKVSSGSTNATSPSVSVSVGSAVAAPSVTANGPTTFCTGGSVTLTSSTCPAYRWSNGATTQSITVASQGAYNVTAVSGACTAVSPNVAVTVGSIPTPSITANGPLTFCPGGSVSLTSSPATTYRWSNGSTTQTIVASTDGSYQVTVSSGVCTATAPQVQVSTASSIQTPTITASGSTSICPGSGVTLTSSPSNSYLWSTGATTQSIVATTGGSYSVIAFVNSNCYAQSYATTVSLLSAPSTPTISVTSGSTNLSTGQTVTLKSSSASRYLWSTGATTRSITVSTQGTYRVTTFNSGGCSKTSNPKVVTANGCTPPAVPTITSSGSTTLVTGQTVTLTSSAGGGYLWSNGAQTQSITVSAAGAYTVRVYNAGYCYSTSLPLTVYVIAARVDDNSDLALSAYPNPVSEKLNVSFIVSKEAEYDLRFVDLLGRVVYSQKVSSTIGENHVEMDVTQYQKGIYLVCLSNENEEKHMKIMVN